MMVLLKFLIVGGSATALQYMLLIAFVHLGLTPTIAAGLSYLISACANYLLNYYATFNSNASHQTAIAKFALVAAAGLLINMAIVYLLTNVGAHYLIAQMVATVVILVWNFVLHKCWTYKNS